MPQNPRVDIWPPTEYRRLIYKSVGAFNSLRPRDGVLSSPPVPCRERGCGLASRLMARVPHAGRISVHRSEWVGACIVATGKQSPGSYSRTHLQLTSHVGTIAAARMYYVAGKAPCKTLEPVSWHAITEPTNDVHGNAAQMVTAATSTHLTHQVHGDIAIHEKNGSGHETYATAFSFQASACYG